MKSFLPVKVIIFGSLIYISIFFLAMLYAHFLFSQTAKSSSSLPLLHQRLLNASPSAAYIFMLELGLMIISVVAELRYKLLSRGARGLYKLIAKSRTNQALTAVILITLSLLNHTFAVYLIIILMFLMSIFIAISITEKKANYIPLAYALLSLLLTYNLFQQIAASWLMLPAIVFFIMLYFIRKNRKLFTNLFGLYFNISYAILVGLLLTPLLSLLMLAVMSVYDLWAVFVGRTMQKLVVFAAENQLPVMYMFGDTKEINSRLKRLKEKKKESVPAVAKPAPRSMNGMILGTGDTTLPAILIASFVFAGSKTFLFGAAGYELAFSATLGACLGLAANIFILNTRKPRSGIPALPLILAGQGLCILLGALLLR